MEISICKGRPKAIDERMTCAFELLDRLGISYTCATHPAAADMVTCDAVAEALQTDICKNLFLCNRQQTAFYLLLMPGNKKFKTKDISQQINSARLSFADEEAMERLLGLTPGSVTILGLMNDSYKQVRLLIDKDIMQAGSIGVHPCLNTATVKFSTEELTSILIPALKHEPTFVELPWYTDSLS